MFKQSVIPSRLAKLSARADRRIRGENFSGQRITQAYLENQIHECNFSKATLDSVRFQNLVVDCDFSGAKLKATSFWRGVERCLFTNAKLRQVSLRIQQPKPPDDSDQETTPREPGLSFVEATLDQCSFAECTAQALDFSRAKITRSWFIDSELEDASFAGAQLEHVRMVGCKLVNADFTNADLTGTNLAYADLTGANFKGANLRNVNLRGAILTDAKLTKAKNLAKTAHQSPALGPALRELDHIAAHSERIQVAFEVPTFGEKEESTLTIYFPNVQYSGGLGLPNGTRLSSEFRAKLTKLSDALIVLSNIAYPLPVNLEQVRVGSKKSPLGGRALSELVIRGMAEAFEQPIPKSIKLEYPLDKQQVKQGIARLQQEKAELLERKKQEAVLQKQAEAEAEAEVKQDAALINRQVKKTIGPVNDPAKFLQALELRLEKPKIKNATAMLRASGFELFHDLTSKQVTGVVKSQRDASLVYACCIGHDGKYSCCTQNLNMCGGLRGSICKHLLVLLIGLVKAGKLAPATIDLWIAKSRVEGVSFDEETMTAVFLKYKSAELGEIDWRPTETIPEDFYT